MHPRPNKTSWKWLCVKFGSYPQFDVIQWYRIVTEWIWKVYQFGFAEESWLSIIVWFVHAALVGELTKSHNFPYIILYYRCYSINIVFFLLRMKPKKRADIELSYNARTCQHFNTSIALDRQNSSLHNICVLYTFCCCHVVFRLIFYVIYQNK